MAEAPDPNAKNEDRPKYRTFEELTGAEKENPSPQADQQALAPETEEGPKKRGRKKKQVDLENKVPTAQAPAESVKPGAPVDDGIPSFTCPVCQNKVKLNASAPNGEGRACHPECLKNPPEKAASKPVETKKAEAQEDRFAPRTPMSVIADKPAEPTKVEVQPTSATPTLESLLSHEISTREKALAALFKKEADIKQAIEMAQDELHALRVTESILVKKIR